ncbi:MAG TPA: trigger factor [Steroidobacteraceae bacterium]|nr:trigger factor [Steroidobacteraceae bacterium]
MMQVSVSDTGGLGKRLEVAVPATEVASAVAERLKRLSRTARLKGFRPGKAPLAVIAKQFGDQVRAEVVSDLMRSSFAQAVNETKLKPAAGPRIEPIALGPETDLKYAAHFEVLPEVRVKPPDGMQIERPKVEVTEADIDAMIENMRAQRPVFTEADRAARDTDRVTIDYRVRVGGKAFEGSDATDVRLIIGSHQSIPELEAGLKGTSAGEERTITATFPAAHPNKTLAGQTGELHVSIKRVEEQSLPALDEAFFREYGVEEGGLAEMRAEVRKSMERELADVIRGRLRAQVLDSLYKDNPLELPRSLVDEQVQAMQIEAARRLGVREASQVPPREPFEEPARRRVALGLLMSHIVQTQALKVDPARLRERLDELAAGYPNPDEARRAYQQNADAMRQIESAALEEEVVDWALKSARITDRPMSFADLTGFGRERAGHEHDHSHEHAHDHPHEQHSSSEHP